MLLFHNVLIVDSLSIQPTSEAEFWTWKGVLAICAILVFLGWFIDWLHRKRHKEAILKKLSEFEDKLARLPVSKWQVGIARAVIRFWEWLAALPDTLFLRGVNRMSRDTELVRQMLPSLALVVFFISVLAMLSLSAVVFGVSLSWPLTLVFASLAGYSCWSIIVILPIPFLILALILERLGYPRLSSRIRDWIVHNTPELMKLLRPLLHRVSPVLLMSVMYTGSAIAAGLLLSPGAAESYWFAFHSGNLSPGRPISVSLLNFPFDFITILVSIKLLRFVKEKSKHIISIALIDIVISGVLVILLHTTLKTVEPGGVTHLGRNFMDSWDWFVQVVTFKASSSHPDWPLTPTLFTTFIPVTLYMSAFIFLGIIIKPFARAASYICGLLFEKKQTPFLAFSLILSGLLTVAKALSEWEWFLHLFKRLLS